jgi:hypothetical protein
MQRSVASEFKLGRESFTRDGALSPGLLISLLLYMAADGGHRGYQHVVDGFWEQAELNRVPLPCARPVSAAAFCNARKRLCSSAVRQLLRDASDEFDRVHGQRHRLKGRRVLAVDGCKMPLQRAPELWREFGGPSEGFTPQMTVSVLFDVIAKAPLDATIAPYASDERVQLGNLLASTREGDLIVIDRGYPSYVVIDLLMEYGLDFVVRVQVAGGFSAVDEFVRSGKDEAEIVLQAPPDSPARVIPARSLRVVRRFDADGNPQVFLTSLSRSEFSHGDICDLYQRRWQIELFYRLEKSDYAGHKQFHAKYADGVRQEVFAALLFSVISRSLMAAAAQSSGATYDRISQKAALLATARRITVLLLEADPAVARQALADLLQRIADRLNAKHRQRSCPRRSFKPHSRWGPHGSVRDSAAAAQVR